MGGLALALSGYVILGRTSVYLSGHTRSREWPDLIIRCKMLSLASGIVSKIVP